MSDHSLQLMMLDIDAVLLRYGAGTQDVMAAAQALAVSAVGNLTNGGADGSSLLRFAQLAAAQIQEAMTARIKEGEKGDW